MTTEEITLLCQEHCSFFCSSYCHSLSNSEYCSGVSGLYFLYWTFGTPPDLLTFLIMIFFLEEQNCQCIEWRTRILLVRRPLRRLQVIRRANWACLTVFVGNGKWKGNQWSCGLFPGLLWLLRWWGQIFHTFGSPFPFVFWLPLRFQLKASKGRDSNIMFWSPQHKLLSDTVTSAPPSFL